MNKFLVARVSADGRMDYTQDASDSIASATNLATDWLKLSLPGAKCSVFELRREIQLGASPVITEVRE